MKTGFCILLLIMALASAVNFYIHREADWFIISVFTIVADCFVLGICLEERK
jgi:hypothetical protein